MLSGSMFTNTNVNPEFPNTIIRFICIRTVSNIEGKILCSRIHKHPLKLNGGLKLTEPLNLSVKIYDIYIIYDACVQNMVARLGL